MRRDHNTREEAKQSDDGIVQALEPIRATSRFHTRTNACRGDNARGFLGRNDISAGTRNGAKRYQSTMDDVFSGDALWFGGLEEQSATMHGGLDRLLTTLVGGGGRRPSQSGDPLIEAAQ
jgi:hypothetical protein